MLIKAGVEQAQRFISNYSPQPVYYYRMSFAPLVPHPYILSADETGDATIKTSCYLSKVTMNYNLFIG